MRKGLPFGAVLIALSVGGLAYAGAYHSGTPGDDTIIIERSGATAYLKAGNDTFVGARGRESGADHVYTGRGNDRATTHGRPDMLRGRQGNDHLDGGPAYDGLYGWRGDDTLIGGPGKDLFLPGPGFDTCVGRRGDGDLHLRRCEVVRFED